MSEMHLRQPGSTYSAWGAFTKSERNNKKFKEKGNASYIYQNELKKSCFEHHIVHRDCKGFPRRAASDKILSNKAFNISKNLTYDVY